MSTLFLIGLFFGLLVVWSCLQAVWRQMHMTGIGRTAFPIPRSLAPRLSALGLRLRMKQTLQVGE